MCGISKPNFQVMSQQELHSHVLADRDDQEAFYAYVDKLHAEANWIEMLLLKSLEDLKDYPEFLEGLDNSSKSQDHPI